MIGASRESMVICAEALDARRSDPALNGLAGELYSVASLLEGQPQLRSVLADSGQPHSVREALVREVLGGKVSALAVDLVVTVAAQRWSVDADLVAAIERLAAQAAFTVAQDRNELDSVEEEIFLFGRAVQSSSELQMALTDPALGADSKAGIVRDILRGRGSAIADEVLQYTVGHLHGQRLDAAIDDLGMVAAAQRQRVVAQVRVAQPLDARQSERLAAALSAIAGRTVRLNVAVDPSVLGGVYVAIGDEVIDGTVATRLEQARRAVLG